MMGSNAIDPRHCYLPATLGFNVRSLETPQPESSIAGVALLKPSLHGKQMRCRFFFFSVQLQPCNLGNPFATSFSYFQYDMRDISCARIVQALCAYYMYHASGWNCQVGLVADIGQKYVS